MIHKYVDTSSTSLGIVLVVFVAIFFLARYLLQTNLTEEKYNITDTHILGISFSIALIVALFIMVAYKKYLVHSGSKTLLEEKFYEA
jgi:uncharacterized membrane protein required for colicin V production